LPNKLIDDSKLLISLNEMSTKSHLEKVSFFNEIDNLLISVNQCKYNNSKDILQYIKDLRSPEKICMSKVTLLTLMHFFQKIYVTHTFRVNLNKIPDSSLQKLEWESINIISKVNNFPHLVGISGLRDNVGKVLSKVKPREFLDGVLYQYILLNNHDDFLLDYEKLEVLPWIHQTLSSPTYILPSSAILKSGTKFHADIIFVRKIFNSDKYVFHIVGLKHEKDTNFAFTSQFAITRNRHYRLKKMFNLEKAIFDFYKEKKISASISSRQAGSIYNKVDRDH